MSAPDSGKPGRGAARVRTVILFAVPVLTVGAVLALTGGEGSAAPGPGPVRADPLRAPAAVPSSVGGPPREPTLVERQVLDRAESVLTADCLRQRGFPIPAPPAQEPVALLAQEREFRYVVDDVGWAREHGYGSDLQSALRAAAAADPDRQWIQDLSPDRRQGLVEALNGRGPADPGPTVRLPTGAVIGHSSRSCSARAEQELYGDFPSWFTAHSIAQSLDHVVQERVRADPRYVAATGRWAACMHAAGHPYATPDQARQRFLDASGPDRALERRTATAEAGCAVRSGLAPTARSLDEQDRASLEDGYRSALATWRGSALAALPRARSVLAAGGTR